MAPPFRINDVLSLQTLFLIYLLSKTIRWCQKWDFSIKEGTMENAMEKSQNISHQISIVIQHSFEGLPKWMPASWKAINMAVGLLNTICKNV